jgi:uncharacterized protein (DUF58 family)
MIVPRSRLLFWFAAIVLPFSVLGALYPAASLLALILILALLALAITDAALGYALLDGVSIKLPEVIRASCERPATIVVTMENRQQKNLQLRVGLVLPRSISSASEDVFITLPEGVERSSFEWTCVPMRRGRYSLTRAYAETASRVGFWALRRSIPVQCELRVYPNLLAERKTLASLFLNRGWSGLHAQRQVGKGRDFEKLREYIPGDSYDEIHWKATARRGHPVTKVFQIERTQEVYVVMDASRLSAREAVPSPEFRVSRLEQARLSDRHETQNLEPGSSALERYITSALVLAQAAEKQGDLFGLLTFTDRVETFLRARNGKEHYGACRDALCTLETRNISPDFDEIASFIRTRLRRRALLIFLTSLDDPVLAEGFLRNMSLLAGQHLVLVTMIQPPRAAPLFSGDDVFDLDDLYRHLGGHLQWHNLRELGKVLQRRGVQFTMVENESLANELVSQYLGVKQRQLI